ncbi:hypothetical protein E2C01_029834 [Portunus trituberculatus]|uniref:Uncharacterized protein n=1 Tax=Portunus trituberculatus TaxID=210409 RepID=A0A5B7ET24_PORTR|nr:hypothetical protein [Portunus trituberculatus]
MFEHRRNKTGVKWRRAVKGQPAKSQDGQTAVVCHYFCDISLIIASYRGCRDAAHVIRAALHLARSSTTRGLRGATAAWHECAAVVTCEGGRGNMEGMQDVPVECAVKLHEEQLRSSRDEEDIFVGMLVWMESGARDEWE